MIMSGAPLTGRVCTTAIGWLHIMQRGATIMRRVEPMAVGKLSRIVMRLLTPVGL